MPKPACRACLRPVTHRVFLTVAGYPEVGPFGERCSRRITASYRQQGITVLRRHA